MGIRVLVCLAIIALCVFIVSEVFKLFWQLKVWGVVKDKLHEYEVAVEPRDASPLQDLEDEISKVEDAIEDSEDLDERLAQKLREKRDRMQRKTDHYKTRKQKSHDDGS